MFTLADSFGNRLKEERARLGLTQEALAERTGIRSITIIQYEKEKSSPPVKFLRNLQNAGLDIVYLLTGVHASPVHNELSPKVLKEIADMMDKIEFEVIGEPLSTEARVKLTVIMLEQYSKKADQESMGFSGNLISSLAQLGAKK